MDRRSRRKARDGMIVDLKCPMCRVLLGRGGCPHRMAEIVEYLNALPDLIARAQNKNTELNRRAQKAESAARQTVEENRRKGQSFGRGLANWAASDYERRLKELEKYLHPLKKLTVHADGTQTISHVSGDAVEYEYLLRRVAKTYCYSNCPARAGGVHEAICQDVRAKLGISPKGSLKALRPLAGACLAPGDFSPVEVTVYCGQCGDEIEKAATCGKCPGRKQEEN